MDTLIPVDTKNLGPKALSLLTATIIAVMNTLLSMLLKSEWYIILLVFLSTFTIIYGLYLYTLQRFIYRKIKLIYKFISQTKATKREEFFYEKVLPQKSIDEVRNDVEKWAANRKDEIEMLQANEQFRKEFLMNLAHELRTPIFTIQGYIDTLLQGALEDEQVNRKFLSNASKGIDRLVRLAEDLDHISKLESGQTPLSKENFNIQELVKLIFEEFSLKAAEKGVHLELKKGTERNLSVHADKGKIKQVIGNLVENALKYCDSSCTITFAGYTVDERQVYLEISDNGPGISEEHLPRLFERFYRADKSRNRNIGGTGLGLAIVKHIIDAHGQTVTVRSKLNVGSSFGFTLEEA